jgi:multidrug transporter EmrE-like cation transporter
MFNINYIFILGSVVTIVCGQIIFKYAAKELQIDPSFGYITLVRTNIQPVGLVVSALALYLIATMAWIQALRTVPLSIAFMFNSIAFVLVPLASFLLFHEQIPKFFIPGVAMIIAGIFLISR